MELYTFIMEYIGGTYIHQVEAIDYEQARSLWIRNLEIKEIKHFSIHDKRNIIKENFSDEDIILVKGMKNVWFFLIRTKRGLGYINIIKTKR